MSHTTSLVITSEVKDLWKTAIGGSPSANGGGAVRYLQLRIQQEQVVLASSASCSSSVSQDYNKLSECVSDSEACYFLFNVEGKRWLFITYVPEKVSVKDKMVYASSKAALKNELGFSHFEEDVHVTLQSELNYDVYTKGKKPVESRSNDEIVREKIIKMEDQEREERKQIGGYHSVAIPLTDAAKESLKQLQTGSANFVELVIDSTTKDKVNAHVTKTLTVAELPNNVVTTEPRFYVYNYQSSRGGIVKKSSVFIYCCPEKSPPKLRMVYSTAKPQVAGQIEQLGIQLAPKRIEIREASELTEELLSSDTLAKKISSNPSSPSSGKGDGTTKAAKVPTVNAPHPVYNLLAPNDAHSPRTKKIVIPPPGAY